MIGLRRGEFVEMPDSTGWRLGVGLFETLRWNGSTVRHWGLHAERLAASLADLGLACGPFPGPDDAVRLALHAGLAHREGRVNILCPFDDLDVPAVPLLLAAPYDPPPPAPVSLAVFPDPHASFLGRHKTMSHLPYLVARRHAARLGCFDALLADREGLVVETSACALLLADDEGLVAPAHPCALPSTALALMAGVQPVRRRPVLLDDLPGFRHAFVCNSLFGMRAVSRIGEVGFALDEETVGLGNGVIL